MPNFVDFKALKQRVSMLDVMQMLDLKTVEKSGNHRCACPVCEGGPRTLSITPAEGVFKCFSADKGGDCISLAAHVLQVSAREAAIAIDKRFPEGRQAAQTARAEAPSPKPRPPRQDAPSDLQEVQGQLAKIKARLVHNHEILAMMGIPEIVACATGIGYDPRYKRVQYPLYTNGEHVGYVGQATEEDQVPLMMFHKNLVGLCTLLSSRADPGLPIDAKAKFLRVVK